jgi:hypothetical protein
MAWVSSAEIALAIAALAVSLATLVPIAYQSYLDHWSAWPYDIVFVGRLRDPVAPWMPTLGFRFKNRTRAEAFFEVRISGDGIARPLLPGHISVWPSREEAGLYVPIPPRTSREIRILPFGPQYGTIPPRWTLTLVEYTHRRRPVVLQWPTDLDSSVETLATDIPVPPSK